MIINNSIVEDAYRCTKPVMRYLVETCNLPVLSYDNKYYHFANTKHLKTSLESMPFYLKVLECFPKKEGGKM